MDNKNKFIEIIKKMFISLESILIEYNKKAHLLLDKEKYDIEIQKCIVSINSINQQIKEFDGNCDINALQKIYKNISNIRVFLDFLIKDIASVMTQLCEEEN